jgi:hypothetical protein
MSVFDQIFGSGAAGVGDLVAKVVGTFKLSPEAQLEFQKQLEEHKFELDKLDAEYAAKAADDASANIQAEAKGNWYTAGARPTFMYVVEFILLWNYVIVPIFRQMPVELPGDLLVLFGTCVCGYVASRGYEKVNGVK